MKETQRIYSTCEEYHVYAEKLQKVYKKYYAEERIASLYMAIHCNGIPLS